MVSGKNRTATRHARRRRANQCQGSCCWLRTHSMSNSSECRITTSVCYTLCNAIVGVFTECFFVAVCVGVFVAFSACAPWMIEYRTYRCSFGSFRLVFVADQRSNARVCIQSQDAHVAQCSQTRIDSHYVTPDVEHQFDARRGFLLGRDGRILCNMWAKQLLAVSVSFVDVAEVLVVKRTMLVFRDAKLFAFTMFTAPGWRHCAPFVGQNGLRRRDGCLYRPSGIEEVFVAIWFVRAVLTLNR